MVFVAALPTPTCWISWETNSIGETHIIVVLRKELAFKK
jgi:hypothetical protein